MNPEPNTQPKEKQKPGLKRVIGIAVGIALCLVLLPLAVVGSALAVKSYMNPGKVATVLGIGPLIVDTDSMVPEFKGNDLLLVRETNASALNKDDIIAYYDGKGTVVTHRIIGYDMTEGGARLYITKGDANNTQDRSPVPASRVAGLVVRVIPGGGKVMRFIGNPVVTVIAIALPLALFYGVIALRKKITQKKGKEAVPDINEPRPQA